MTARVSVSGPQSAGANPGPKAYRRGGPLTVTDANVMLGKLSPAFFPAIFGETHDQPIDADAVRGAFAELARQVGEGRTAEEIADGAIRIAVENMANAIKKISVERGYDVTEYALNCFGSAGGQHACLIADTLGIETVLVHPLSGLLSAYGIGLAQQRASRERSIEAPLGEETMGGLEDLAYGLGSDVTEQLLDDGVEHDAIAIESFAHLRYAGTDTALAVPLSEPHFMRRDFEALHRQRFGFVSPEKGVFVAALEVAATGGGGSASDISITPAGDKSAPAARGGRTRFYSRGAWHEAPVLMRDELADGEVLSGPALVIEPNQTIVVEAGWDLTLTPGNDIVLRRAEPRARERLGAKADPVLLEVFNNLFMAIAEQMGEALRNTAQSVNIKERLDFSCAVFDASGALVANAPHLPVHLGSMDRSVEAIIRERGGTMRPGDSFMLNAPYNGGTHLPDITVVTPVFDDTGAHTARRSEKGGQRHSDAPSPLTGEGRGGGGAPPSTSWTPTSLTLPRKGGGSSEETQADAPGGRGENSDPGARVLFYVASRGHHEDIGGLTPGSMTPRATIIEEEGVYIDNFKLVDQGRFLEEDTRKLLLGAKYPARRPDKNVADLKAQVAANAKGEAELRRMVAHFGIDVCRSLYAARSGQCRGGGAAAHLAAGGRALPRRDRPGCRGAHHGRSSEQVRQGGLHGHQRAAAEQLQRARTRHARGGSLRHPRDGRRADPDERRLPQADRDRHPRGLDAAANLSGRGCRRQRRDEPDRHQRAVRGARRARLGRKAR